MNRRGKRKLLFRMKVLTICGAAVFTVKGVSSLGAQTTSAKKEVTGKAVTMEEIETLNADAAAMQWVEEITETEETQDEYHGLIGSMDWGSEDAYLLAKIAMAEAEGESTEGKALVMLTVLNRVWSDGFPDTIEEVIFERGVNGKGNTVYQFSVMQDGGRWWTTEPNEDCYKALELIQVEKWDESQGALYFESKSDSTWHEDNLQFLFQRGNHYFYKNKELTE